MSQIPSTQSRASASATTLEPATAVAAPASNGENLQKLTNVDACVKKLVASAVPTTPEQAIKLLEALSEGSHLPGVVPVRNSVNFIDSLLHRIDEQVTTQLNEVMHDPKFLQLEGTWRGLQRLLKDTDTNKTLWVEMLDVTKDELRQDFQGASDYSQSALWKRVYEERYDTRGGQPVGAFVSGFEFNSQAPDVALLSNLSKVAAAAQAPMIVSASPALLGLSSFSKLKNVVGLKNTFNNDEYTAWNQLRKNPDSRFLAVTLPRFLARLPYGSQTLPASGLNYEEAPMNNRKQLTAVSDQNLCWSSASYAFGSVLTKSFRQTNWCSAIMGDARGKLNGGTVGDLPLHTFINDGGNPEVKPPTETVIPGDKEYALAEMGLLPLSYELASNKAVFVGGKTLFEPQGRKGTPDYNNDVVASLLLNVLPASRISHYMKTIAREQHGQLKSAEQLKSYLQTWLAQFKGDPSDSEINKTQKPLEDFSVEVKKGLVPGVYDVSMKLKFWSVILQINADVSMVAELNTTNK